MGRCLDTTESRGAAAFRVSGFWVMAFQNHPCLSTLIEGLRCRDVRYISNLDVKEVRHPRMLKFKFFFQRNPYMIIRNNMIIKEYEVGSSRQMVSPSTPIIWHWDQEPQSFVNGNQDFMCNFFAWFSESDRIAEIIKEDLWLNPLQCYLWYEGPQRARLCQRRYPGPLGSNPVNICRGNTSAQGPLPTLVRPVCWQQR